MANYTPHNEYQPLSDRDQRIYARTPVVDAGVQGFGEELLAGFPSIVQFPDIVHLAQTAPDRGEDAQVRQLRPDVKPDVAGAVINNAVQASTAHELAIKAQLEEITRILKAA